MSQPPLHKFFCHVPASPPHKPHVKGHLDSDEVCIAETPPTKNDQDVSSDRPNLCDLGPGPCQLTLTCRIIAVQHRPAQSASASSLRSKGHWKLCLKDDTAAITILLYYNTKQYLPLLGELVRVRVPHLSHGNSRVGIFDGTSLFASIFPERDSSCSFATIDEPSLCRRPVEFQSNHFKDRLTSLSSFVGGGHELTRSVLLVCVKSVGPRVERMVKNKNGEERKVSVADVRVFDRTGGVPISFWDALSFSPGRWIPNETTLLIYSAGYDSSRHRLLVRHNSYIDVDPHHVDAEGLVRWTSQKTEADRQSNMEPPSSVFDVDEALSGQRRILFTLAVIDEWARGTPPGMPIIGFLSLIVLELNICKLRRSHQVCYAQCCGTPVHANSLTAICKHCQQSVTLRLNPVLVGPLLDETGSIACGQLLWTDKAWEELFGQEPRDLVRKDAKALKSLEDRILHMRLTFLVGWESSLEKLSVLSVTA